MSAIAWAAAAVASVGAVDAVGAVGAVGAAATDGAACAGAGIGAGGCITDRDWAAYLLARPRLVIFVGASGPVCTCSFAMVFLLPC